MELDEMMAQLSEMKAEYREKRKVFKAQTKTLLDSIKSLENIITDEVLKLGKTVTVGNIKAEYVPQVRIRMKREDNNG